MCTGRTEEAAAIARHVRTPITRSSSKWLRKVDTRKSAKDAWTKVREVTKGRANQAGDQVDGLTAQVFNNHYAAISTDADYRAPRLKQTAPNDQCHVTSWKWTCFACWTHCDRQQMASIGYRRVFLRLGVPVFATSLARLFHRSLYLQRVSCSASGRLPPSPQYPRSLRRLCQVTSGQSW